MNTDNTILSEATQAAIDRLTRECYNAAKNRGKD